MKIVSKICILIGFAIMACFGTVTAEEASPSFASVDIYACNFRDGKDMDDLAKVTKKWNAWMDTSNGPAYSAYNLIPFYHSQEVEFDVGWLGVWADGVTMGAGIKHWLGENGNLHTAFNKVLDCVVHQNFAALTIKAEKTPGTEGPVEFSNCTAKKDITVKEAIAAIREWSDHEVENGSDAARYILFPAYGETSKAKYDFKYVEAYPSYDSFGQAYDRFGNGGGYMDHRKIVERVMNCDSARVYDSRVVRLAK